MADCWRISVQLTSFDNRYYYDICISVLYERTRHRVAKKHLSATNRLASKAAISTFSEPGMLISEVDLTTIGCMQQWRSSVQSRLPGL